MDIEENDLFILLLAKGIPLKNALDIAREVNDIKQMRSCYGMLSETFEKKGDYKQSMYYFELYRKFNEIVEGKKGATNSLERKIEKFFNKRGYEVGILINYHGENTIRVQLYKTDVDGDITLEYDMDYNNQTPTQIYKETMKRI